MNSNPMSSRRTIGIILLLMVLLCVMVIAAGYQGLLVISHHLKVAAATGPETASLKSALIWLCNITHGFKTIATPLIAVVFFLWSFLIWLCVRPCCVQPPPVSPAAAPEARENAAVRKQQNTRLFLHLIGTLQKEGRLLDFLSENLDGYEDAQIGAAVRSIHESCQSTVHKYLTLAPVLDQEEGDSITLQKGFDTSSVKLIGNVTGEPPFTGTVRHKGWKATGVEIPTLSGDQDASLMAPAEVEI